MEVFSEGSVRKLLSFFLMKPDQLEFLSCAGASTSFWGAGSGGGGGGVSLGAGSGSDGTSVDSSFGWTAVMTSISTSSSVSLSAFIALFVRCDVSQIFTPQKTSLLRFVRHQRLTAHSPKRNSKPTDRDNGVVTVTAERPLPMRLVRHHSEIPCTAGSGSFGKRRSRGNGVIKLRWTVF